MTSIGRERAVVRRRQVGLCPRELELGRPRLRMGPRPRPQHRNAPGTCQTTRAKLPELASGGATNQTAKVDLVS